MKKWNDIFDETPAGFHLSVERALGEMEDSEMKKSIRKMPIIMFAIIAVMLAATAVAATQYFGGVIDWNGNYTELSEDDVPMATSAPDELRTDWNDYAKYIENVPAGEYWEVWDGTGSGSGAYGPIGNQATSTEELASMLEGNALTVINTPANYDVSSIEISYDSYNIEREKYDSEAVNGNGMLYKYKLAEPDMDDIDGYLIDFTNADGNKISINASLFVADNYEEGLVGNFMIDEGEEYEVIDNVNFDRGIVITRTNGAKTIRLQRDKEGGVIESYYINVIGDVETDSVIDMLFE